MICANDFDNIGEAMKYFRLVFYQSLILFASIRSGLGERFDNDLKLQLVSIDGIVGLEERSWQWIVISRGKYTFEYTFRNRELDDICGGAFRCSNAEIMEVFGRVVRICLTRPTNQLFFINLMFAVKYSVQVFVENIRSQHTMPCSRKLPVAKLVQYLIPRDESQDNPEDGSQNDPQDDSHRNLDNQQRTQLMAKDLQFFLRALRAQWFPNQTTINFLAHGRDVPIEHKGLLLVLQSRAFNISPIIGTDMYILCSYGIVTHYFMVFFANDECAIDFYTIIAPYLNYQIPCPTDWLTPEILELARTAEYPRRF